MKKLWLILLLCPLFAACSDDDDSYPPHIETEKCRVIILSGSSRFNITANGNMLQRNPFFDDGRQH